MRYRQLLLTFLPTILAFVIGCGDRGPEQYEVSGTITYDGAPVVIGTIRFEPTREAGLEAPTGFAVIRDGNFRTESSQGAGAGSYVARISAGDGKPTDASGMSLDPEGPPTVDKPFGNPLLHEFAHPLTLPEGDSTVEINVPRQ